MKTKEELNKLQHRLQLIEGFQAVEATFKNKKISNEISNTIKNEIKEFAQKRIEQIDNGTESVQFFQFNEKEYLILRQLLNKISNNTHQTKKISTVQSVDNENVGIISKIIEQNKNRLAEYDGQKVKILAQQGGKAVIQDVKTGRKVTVFNKELSVIT